MTSDRYRSPLTEADDEILADRAADGDPDAFAVLVRRHAPIMRAYARRLLPGSSEVDDVVQEAFLAAWDQLDGLEDRARVRAWLIRITGRKAFDRIRATKAHSDLGEMDLPAPERMAPPRRAEARAGIAALGDAITRLPEAQRECWVLRELGDYSYDEIAAELDVPVSTVRGLLARARKDIIIRMEQWR